MALYAIGDLHLPGHDTKPMDVFGSHWEGHFETISDHWRRMVTPEDLVLIPGDISWGMQLSDARDDLEAISRLPGEKVLLRGNHDYWWNSLSKVRQAMPEGMHVVQNDALLLGDRVICGTRGWTLPTEDTPLDEQNEKIYRRELLRLEMSLKAACRLRGEGLVVMFHFPPVLSDQKDTEFTRLLEQYPVRQVVYGHLHGAGIKNGFSGEKNGIRYDLVSCDALHFCPLKIQD